MKLPRSCGVLLHITSLPGKYGTGTLGREARDFADCLKAGGQRFWQVLPIGPVVSPFGYSPYASTSTFAGNHFMISMESLSEEEWCSAEPEEGIGEEGPFIDFENVDRRLNTFLEAAFHDFETGAPDEVHEEFDSFCRMSSFWLDEYALYTALALHFGSYNWLDWEKPIAMREPGAMAQWREALKDRVRFHSFVQFVFFRQWNDLHEYCGVQGIQLIGDIPIYITLEGADAWSNPGILDLCEKTGKPLSVAGVPPDYFSETGQRWGNPLYRWRDAGGKLNEETAAWWKERILHLSQRVDIVRIDHFRGFESFWAIPADEETAVNGEWVEGPGMEFFARLKHDLGELPLIAEDLGVITPEVKKLRDGLGLPGMKILQFAFDFNNMNEYLPHNIENHNCILYTGTHDNNTTNGWFYEAEVDENGQQYIMEYIGSEKFSDFHWQLIRLAYMSVANLVIVPAQDILGYGAMFRMNTPGTAHGNWRWKLTGDAVTEDIISRLARMARMYRRISDTQEDEENGSEGEDD